ncbi:hypothetical protein NBRC116599_16920 [Aquicoccus sp. SU-CL01552]
MQAGKKAVPRQLPHELWASDLSGRRDEASLTITLPRAYRAIAASEKDGHLRRSKTVKMLRSQAGMFIPRAAPEPRGTLRCKYEAQQQSKASPD